MMVKIVVETLPPNGGSPITAVQYRRDGGSPVALPSPTPGEYDTEVEPGEEVEIRAVNAIGNGPWSAPKIFSPAITAFSREYTADIGDVTINLAVIGPAEAGTTTYTLIGSPTGAAVSGATLTIDTETAASGTITVRRSDDNGLRDLVLTLGMVTPSISVTGGNATATVGADDPSATEYAFEITGGDYDGETVTFTKAQLVAIEPSRGLPVLPPEIELTTDADSDAELDADDVAALARPGLRVHPAGQTAPTLNGEWHIDGVATGVTGSTFTDDAPEGDELTYVETDGETPSESAAIPVAEATAPFDWTELGDQTLGGSAATTKTLTSAVDSQPFEREVFFWLFDESNSLETINVTIAGVTANKIVERLSDALSTIRGYHATIGAGVSGDIVLTKATNIFQFARALWGWTPPATVEAAVVAGAVGNNITHDVSQNVAAGSFVLVASAHRSLGTITWPLTVTVLKSYTFAAGRASFGIVPSTTAGMLTLTCVEGGEGDSRRGDACSIELIPE